MYEFICAKYAAHISDQNKKLFCQASIRQIWHAIFDHAPTLNEALKKESTKKVFDQFLTRSLKNNQKVDWYTPLYFYKFFKDEKFSSHQIKKELIINACRLWVKTNRSKKSFLTILFMPDDSYVVAKKWTAFDRPPKITIKKRATQFQKENCFFQTNEVMDLQDLFSNHNKKHF